jgi:myb proto-oncogene protein
MGFDPMTHRPRTDFFAALPQLIALANLRQLVEQGPWDDHAARLQVEAVQAAKLQCLQNLIQSAASIATSPSSSSINTIPDLEQIGLLSPPQMSSLSSLPSPSFMDSISGQDIVAGQVPDIQIPSSFFEQPTSNDANQNSDFTPKSSVEGENGTPKTLLLSENSLPPLTDFPISNFADACSVSSCDGSSIQFPSWPELFDEQFLSEFV